MKTLTASILLASAITLSVNAADVSVKISKVHLCCKSCVTGVEKAVGEISGVTAAIDKDAGTVTLNGSDADAIQKAAKALVAAGYYGKSGDSKIKVNGASKSKNVKVQTLKVEGVHLCCGKCVSGVADALKTVAGVKSQNAEKGAKSFEVTGDFNQKEVFTALHKAGFAGKVGK